MERFLEISKDIHKNKYGYSKVKYVNQSTLIIIDCPIHGEFKQIPKSHRGGHGCKECSNDSSKERYTGRKKIHKLDSTSILNRLKSIYSEYDYKDCEIDGTRDKSIIKNIICPTHGYFSKRLNNHMRLKQGCNKCGSNKMNTEEFIFRSKIIHQSKYNYEESVYINNISKVSIICPIHGKFSQRAGKHLYGQGCPICYSTIKSKGESYIMNFLIERGVIFEYQKIIPNLKLRMDFYIPSLKICIEYDGIQHFEPRSLFGGESEYKAQIERDQKKNKYCNDNGINLFRISYKEFIRLNDILVEIIPKN